VGTDAILLRAQSDGRLVRLVREGYESAFEEIVRRYRRPLDRFAASIVGGRSEDVTQDSFRKALEALRVADGEIELRPWLYRIVRNTALNDLRDRPPVAAELAEDLMAGGRSAAAVAEERAEVAALTARLRELPQNQRAALVMRELEGMSHEEIAAALGISGGGARQAIARGRAAVRGGLGALVPLPLLRALVAGGDAGTEAALGAGGATAAGGAGAALLGAGGATALKVGLATIVVAGGISAGVAIDHHDGAHPTAGPPKAVAQAPVPAPNGPKAARVASTPSPATPSPAIAEGDDDDRREGHERHEGHRHHGSGPEDEPAVAATPTVVDVRTPEPVEESGGGPGPNPKSDSSGGPGSSRPSGGRDSGGRGGGDHSGHGGGSGDGGGSGSGGGSGRGDSGSSGDDGGSGSTSTSTPSASSGSGSGSSGSSSGGHDSSGGHGSDDLAEAVVEAPPVEPLSTESSTSGGPGHSPSSDDDGSGSSGGYGSSDDAPEISP
jgi:RNA polymerase sigma factor (sigma-70 family)